MSDIDHEAQKRSRAQNDPPNDSGGDSTRQSLIESALERFGAKGYDAASTREIAAAAETNIGSIAYYFGGKEGLRRAAAEYVVALMGKVARAALGEPIDEADGNLTAEEARQRLDNAARHLVRFFFIQPQARLAVRFVLREVTHPSPALDIIYGGVMRPIHTRLCRLWATVTGENPESEDVRLAVFAMIGQVFYFRIGEQVITRRMDWAGYGPSEVEAITTVVLRNLNASLDASIVRANATMEKKS